MRVNMRGYSFGVRKLRSAYVHPEKVAQAGTVGARGHQRQAARARPDGWEGEFRDLGSRAFRTTAAPKAYQESDRVAVRAARIDEPRMYKVTDPNAPGPARHALRRRRRPHSTGIDRTERAGEGRR